jgi:4-amino-4-deoxy-L-arabinose transferase-like glycosyltransferase
VPRLAVLVGLLVVSLWTWVAFRQVNGVGLLGPDEPRYAAIGRAMAQSGDWVTPRLWGEPWFEKPALLYWMTGLGTRLGLPGEIAARGPVMLLSLLFLLFFVWAGARLLGPRPGAMAALLLATSAGWLAYTEIAVTDLPLAVLFNVALLGAALRLKGGPAWLAWVSGAALGLGVLAKGLVPLLLILPLLYWARRAWRDALRAAVAAAVVALPWYAAVTARNGTAFLYEFFVRHHFSRFVSPELQHVEPFWYYLPVLLAGVFPWTPLIAAFHPKLCREMWREQQHRILMVTVLFGFLVFSASTNKLPGYLLPLLPGVCLLLARALEGVVSMARPLAAAALLLSLTPVIGSTLPDALLHGISRADWGGLPWEYVALTLPICLAVWWLERSGRRMWAVVLVAAAALGGVTMIKRSAWPVLDEVVSARGLWRKVEPRRASVCIESLQRTSRYGLNYYSVEPLPDCDAVPRPLHIVQEPGMLPQIRFEVAPSVTP